MMNFIDAVLSYVFPPRCISCAEVLPINYLDRMCGDCHGLLERCGNDASGQSFSLYEYNDTVRHAIHRFKYGLRRDYGKYLGALMAEHASEVLPRGSAVDVVVPVPLHADKLRERGFNQAEILAEAVCERLGLALDASALTRVRSTEHQARLSASERRENMENAFAVRDTGLVGGKTVLLIDDIYTTGSTVSACTSVLLRAGANRVFSYAFSKATLEDSRNYEKILKLSKNANINDKLFR
ncbi:MAG: ComF family protein [Defluviitaleaceae bacterium]|nr:ComF family protein [Defluviitaleaceae bacterium]